MRMGLRLRRGKLRTSGAVGGTGPYSGCGLKRDHTPLGLRPGCHWHGAEASCSMKSRSPAGWLGCLETWPSSLTPGKCYTGYADQPVVS